MADNQPRGITPIDVRVDDLGLVIGIDSTGEFFVINNLRVLRVLRDELTAHIKRRRCDGNHAEPRCTDPECWHGEEPGNSGAPMNTGGK